MKRTKTTLLLYGILLFATTQLQAQSPCEDLHLPRERVSLQLDRNVCLAGETIWFKAWCFVDGEQKQELSKVLYVEIFDETQQAIVQEKYVLSGHTAAGAIRIPEDVPSKYYFLKAYTRYMRNFSPDSYHYQQLIIANPLIENARIQSGITAEPTESKPVKQPAYSDAEHQLQIKLSQNKYQAREPFSFQVSSESRLKAELSVTVRVKGMGKLPAQEVIRQNKWLQSSCLADPFCNTSSPLESLPDQQQDSEGEANNLPLRPGDLRWLPETRGLTISGFIQNESEEQVPNARAMVAIVQDEPMLHMGTTDEDGAFTICLQHLQEQKALFIGTPDEKNRVLIRNDFDTDAPDVTAVPLQFDSALHALLSSLHLHHQLDRTYPEHETEPTFQARQLRIPSSNILAPDSRVYLDDFIEVPTMPEVLNEIANGITIRMKEGKKSLVLFSTEQQKWYDNPLILLDNVPVFNVDRLLAIDPAKIEAIDIIYSDYILGDYTIGGIVSIMSNTDNFAGYEWGEQVAFTTFTAYSIPQTFEQFVQHTKSHYPDFRPVLYWQPNLSLDQEKESEPISIVAPDQPGSYEILVRGFTRSGEACQGYMTFEVVKDK